MKWTIVGLVLLGLLAAFAAAVLFGTLQASKHDGQQEAAPPEVSVVLAAKALPAVAVVDASSVIVKQVARDLAPPEFISDPVQVVGKVLSVTMREGQPFTRSCFAGKSSGLNLAAAVKEGMRAYSLSLPDYGAMEGLLYPGSVVDVLGSFRVPGKENSGREEIISMTLLTGIQVLAVEDRTIVSENSSSTPAKSSTLKRLVTLMVTPKQAQLLQLGQEHGELSLAMRNPLDVTSEGEDDASISLISQFLQPKPAALPLMQLASEPRAPVAQASAPQESAPQWPVMFIRGGASEVQSFPMPVKTR